MADLAQVDLNAALPVLEEAIKVGTQFLISNILENLILILFL